MRKENLKRKGTENGGENEENDTSPTDVEKQDDEQETTANGKENGDSKKGSTSDDDFEDAETGEKDGTDNTKDNTNENGADNEEDKDDDDSEPLAKKSKKSDTSGGKRGKKSGKASKSPVKTKAAKKAKVEENDEQEVEEEEDEEEYEVQEIVDHRKERGGKVVYRIRWKNYGENDDTWEPEETLSCPDLIKKYKAKMEKEEAATPAKKGKPTPKKGSAKKGAKKPTPKKAAKAAKADAEEDEEDDEKEYEVEKIIDVHFKRDGKREYLVRWKGFTSKDDTWEPADNLNCPHLIEKFNEKLDKSKNASVKELRVARKPTERLSLSLGGRKNSRRNATRTRVTYYDGE